MSPEDAAGELARGGHRLRWPQVADAVRARIADGTLKPGDRPTVAALGPEFGVCPRTAGKALGLLAAEGLLGWAKGTGYAVLPQSVRGPG